MLGNRNAIARKPLTARSALTNDPRTFGGNGNSAQARRFRDLLEALLAQMGNPGDPIRECEAMAAASAMVIAESARGKALRGEPVDLDGLVRLENTASRALRKLGLKAVAPRPPSLQEHLAKRAAERASEQSGTAA